MGRILIVNDGAALSTVLLAALRQAYAEMHTSERSKGEVIVVDSLSTFKENEMLSYWPIHRVELGECSDPWSLKKDSSRSMFLTDARSKQCSHKGRKKKVNRLRVKRRVKNMHRRK